MGALKIGPEDGPGEPFRELCPQSFLRAQTPSAAALSLPMGGPREEEGGPHTGSVTLGPLRPQEPRL